MTSGGKRKPAKADRGAEAGAGQRVLMPSVFDFESAAPGDPVEDLLWTADHGLDSPVFSVFVAGYHQRGSLDSDAPERLAFYELEHARSPRAAARVRPPSAAARPPAAAAPRARRRSRPPGG